MSQVASAPGAKKTANERRAIRLEDLERLCFIAEARLSPDGTCAAAVVHAFDVPRNKVTSRIHLVNVASGSAAMIGTDEGSDGQVTWSRDSARVAFVSQRASGPVLVVHERATMAERAVVSGLRGLGAPRWSPDSGQLAFLAYGPASIGAPEPQLLEPGRRVDRRRQPLDQQGLFDPTSGWARKVWLVDVTTDDIAQLTDGPYDDGDALTGGDLEWSPDGRTLVFAGDRTPGWRDHHRISVLYRLNVGSREIERLTPEDGRAMRPVFSRDGGELAFFGSQGPAKLPLSYLDLVAIDVRTGDRTRLSSATDRAVGTTHNGEPELGPVWSEGGVVTTLCDDGSTNLVRFGRDGSMAPVTRGSHVVQFVSGDTDGRRLLAIRSTSLTTTELVLLENGEVRPVFSPGAELLQEIELDRPVVRWTRRGNVDLQYWVLTPPGATKVPVVLNIHGGPDSQYSETFYFDHAFWAANGYAVVYGNPRGSHGYSSEFLNGVVKDWGGEDAQDILAMLDDALAQDPRLDGSRIVVTGYSYGGYMTNRLIGITDRFKAAVSACGPTDLFSKLGTSDLGRWFERVHYGVSPNERLDWYIDRSPVFAAARIKTPLLMYYGDSDPRVPPSQGDEMLYALSRAGTEVELMRLPGENHGVARPIGIGTGTPAHQRAIRAAVLDWFNRHIGQNS